MKQFSGTAEITKTTVNNPQPPGTSPNNQEQAPTPGNKPQPPPARGGGVRPGARSPQPHLGRGGAVPAPEERPGARGPLGTATCRGAGGAEDPKSLLRSGGRSPFCSYSGTSRVSPAQRQFAQPRSLAPATAASEPPSGGRGEAAREPPRAAPGQEGGRRGRAVGAERGASVALPPQGDLPAPGSSRGGGGGGSAGSSCQPSAVGLRCPAPLRGPPRKAASRSRVPPRHHRARGPPLPGGAEPSPPPRGRPPPCG